MTHRTLMVASLSVCLGGVALAGRQIVWPVTVDLAKRQAWGSLASARNSSDTVQQLGCSVHYDAVNGRNNVNCAAVDASGTAAQCVSQQPELVQIALGINGDSFLQFNWDKGGSCTDIWVVNGSIYEPK